MKKKSGRWIWGAVIAACAGITLLPVVLIAVHSLMRPGDVVSLFSSVCPPIHLIPEVVSIKQYYAVLVEHQSYLEMFFNSLFLTLAIAAAHTCVSFLAGYVLAKVHFPGRGAIYFLYVFFMVMPLQVTLLPVYMASKAIGIYNSWWSLFLPGVFAPLGVFLMRQFVLSVPDELCACVRLDTKSTRAMLMHVVAPCARAGLITLFIVTFAESWNMVEQPLLLLSDPAKYPLSVVLNAKANMPHTMLFAGAVVFMLPTGLLYVLLKEYILDGLGEMVK